MSTRTKSETHRAIARNNDLVTVTTTVTTTVEESGKDQKVDKKVTEEKYSYSGKDGFKSLPDDLRKALDESDKIDPDKIDKKAADSDFAEDTLKKINKYREKHSVSSLKLGDDLVKYATKRAEEMAEKDEFGGNRDPEFGESVCLRQSNDPKFRVEADDIAESFYSASKEYNYDKEPTSMNAGHFTQMVWKSTKKFGAAAAKSNSNTIYVVYVYHPRGNVQDEFTSNVLRP